MSLKRSRNLGIAFLLDDCVNTLSKTKHHSRDTIAWLQKKSRPWAFDLSFGEFLPRRTSRTPSVPPPNVTHRLQPWAKLLVRMFIVA
jgi:hypothetical protein